MDRRSCIRCGDLPAFDEFGMCAHCHITLRNEAALGISVIELYLSNWAAFRAWET
ncbi:MAG: hypothetical protein JO073_04130, partial [Actinobacteria bacterium]|nr:hypothetical protein [Actinomycetota bacterium]